MVPREINPSVQRVSNCTAREDQDPGQALTQRWNHQTCKQQARTNVGDHVRHIRMQTEGGKDPPPLPAPDDAFRREQPRAPPCLAQFRLQDSEQHKQPCDEMERPIPAMDLPGRLIRKMAAVLYSSRQLAFINPQFLASHLPILGRNPQHPLVPASLDKIGKPLGSEYQTPLPCIGKFTEARQLDRPVRPFIGRKLHAKTLPQTQPAPPSFSHPHALNH